MCVNNGISAVLSIINWITDMYYILTISSYAIDIQETTIYLQYLLIGSITLPYIIFSFAAAYHALKKTDGLIQFINYYFWRWLAYSTG